MCTGRSTAKYMLVFSGKRMVTFIFITLFWCLNFPLWVKISKAIVQNCEFVTLLHCSMCSRPLSFFSIKCFFKKAASCYRKIWNDAIARVIGGKIGIIFLLRAWWALGKKHSEKVSYKIIRQLLFLKNHVLLLFKRNF